MSKVLDFLFGKPPKIFNRDGKVEHQLPPKKWETWKNQYLVSPEYNWRNHSGTKAKSRSSSN